MGLFCHFFIAVGMKNKMNFAFLKIIFLEQIKGQLFFSKKKLSR